MSKKTKSKAAPAADVVKLETYEGKANLLTFGFRHLQNGDKLRLIFEINMTDLPDGAMEKIRHLTMKVGELSFDELPPEPKKDPKDLPGQKKLDLMPPGVSVKDAVRKAPAADEIG